MSLGNKFISGYQTISNIYSPRTTEYFLELVVISKVRFDASAAQIGLLMLLI